VINHGTIKIKQRQGIWMKSMIKRMSVEIKRKLEKLSNWRNLMKNWLRSLKTVNWEKLKTGANKIKTSKRGINWTRPHDLKTLGIWSLKSECWGKSSKWDLMKIILSEISHWDIFWGDWEE